MYAPTDFAEKILAAAITLRDSSGRDRLEALRRMASTWNVDGRQKVEGGGSRKRGIADLGKDLEAAVCEAALEWMTDNSSFQGSHRADAEASATADTGTAPNIPKTSTAGEHAVAPPERTGGTIHPLPETANDVISLERLGPDPFDATLKSGAIRRGDAELF